MKTYGNLYSKLCSLKNLELAFKKARKDKALLPYVVEFEESLEENLIKLHEELSSFTYQPRELKTFILRDPKTRKISKSHFRDRVVHHAICNIISPFYNKRFISDSFANRIGKGTFNAIKRFDYFKRKASKNNTIKCYILKADIKHYFDTVNHNIFLEMLREKIKDERLLWLIKIILKNHKTQAEGKGMPLGNLTSQFFANVYLNELDQFVKHNLKAKYYIRYVDDFVILHQSKKQLEIWEKEIDNFLKNELKIELHPDKCKIYSLANGTQFLGYRIFIITNY